MDDLAKLAVSVARVEEKVDALSKSLEIFSEVTCARHMRWTEDHEREIKSLQATKNNAIGGWKALLGAGAIGGAVASIINYFKH